MCGCVCRLLVPCDCHVLYRVESTSREQQFLVKCNGIGITLGMVNPISHITTGDIPFGDSAFLNIITKKYKTWVVKHHPDKVEVTNPTDEFIIKEDGVTLREVTNPTDEFIIKEYGVTLREVTNPTDEFIIKEYGVTLLQSYQPHR